MLNRSGTIHLNRPLLFAALSAAFASIASAQAPAQPTGAITVTVTYPASLGAGPFDGRVIFVVSKDDTAEPRFQISDTGLRSQQVFGVDVNNWKPGDQAIFDTSALGYPVESMKQIPPGTYNVQAVLHKYETLKRADGHLMKLPMDRGEG